MGDRGWSLCKVGLNLAQYLNLGLFIVQGDISSIILLKNEAFCLKHKVGFGVEFQSNSDLILFLNCL